MKSDQEKEQAASGKHGEKKADSEDRVVQLKITDQNNKGAGADERGKNSFTVLCAQVQGTDVNS